MTNFKEDLRKVNAFIFDVDGVFSGSKVLLNSDGQLLRTMNIKDGYAVFYLMRKGYPVAIISGGDSEAVRTRFEKLGINDIYLRSNDKLKDFQHFTEKYDLNPESVLYMGDDLPDYPVMEKVGFPVCPSDAVEEIKSISRYISDRPGGDGCVRDVIEQVLRLNGKWMDAEAFSW
jgi:3-deoxy-D-manno-octulosonate 8-phosphate phosphatase (KDO 8-P phosphatase)